MKTWSQRARKQLLSKTKQDIINRLNKDPDWERDLDHRGAEQIFVNPSRLIGSNRVSIHYHPKEQYQSWRLLSGLLETICWTEELLLSEKFIK